MSNSYVSIQHLQKEFQGRQVLADVSLEMNQGDIMMLVGESGGGKTTLLRILAGLEKEKAGSFILDQGDMLSVPAGKRNVSLMFQQPFLFPHMNVLDNIAFPLKCNKIQRKQRYEEVFALLERLKLSGVENRHPFELSSGQKQRVSLARAIISNPKLLLLDEPLANLDVSLSKEIRVWMVEMLRDLKITTIFVTHNYEEAILSSQRVAVMANGKLSENCNEEGREAVLNFFEEGIYFYDRFIPLDQWRFSDKGLPVHIRSFVTLHGAYFAVVILENGKEQMLPAQKGMDIGKAYIQPILGAMHA